MEQTLQLIFDRGQPAERLDRFLADNLPELTRSQLKKLIDDGRVLLDGLPAKASGKLKGGESLQITLPEPTPAQALPQAIPLAVLYEDSHLVVIDKPAGMVVHPAPGHSSGTLVNALLHHCTDLAGVGGTLRPGIVHRLDKDTSGVLVASKDDATHLHLAAQFKAHTIERRYVALVHGLVTPDSGSIDRPIGRHPTERKRMSSQARSGRRAVTHWKVLRRFDQDRLSLVELRLETGRTHQIRVHFSEQHWPIVGDPVYGHGSRGNVLADPQLRQLVQGLHRQALHARLLGFEHPASGAHLELSSPLPADLQAILDYLEDKYRPIPTGG